MPRKVSYKVSKKSIVSGPASAAIPKLKARVSNYHRRKDISKVYIGQTSTRKNRVGNLKSAMKSRHDGYKKSQGLNQIKALYKTTSGANADKVEKALINYNLKKRTKNVSIKLEVLLVNSQKRKRRHTLCMQQPKSQEKTELYILPFYTCILG